VALAGDLEGEDGFEREEGLSGRRKSRSQETVSIQSSLFATATPASRDERVDSPWIWVKQLEKERDQSSTWFEREGRVLRDERGFESE